MKGITKAYDVPEDMGLEIVANWARKNSLWVIAYGTGCGAIEVPPTMTSRYDTERFGITMMATPRQADVILVTGYVTVKTLKRIIRTYEQMQDPKYVIGFGSCPINGGMYWDSYNTIKMLDKYIPVDTWIAGCMPRPESIIESLLHLQEKIKTGKANGFLHYKENLEWYRANQKKIIKNWNMPDYNW